MNAPILTYKNAAAASTATALRTHAEKERNVHSNDTINSSDAGKKNTAPARLRDIANTLVLAQHCTQAAELRSIARDLESSAADLLTQAQALDEKFWAVPVLERAAIIGRAVGAIRSAASRLVGFEAAHDKAVA